MGWFFSNIFGGIIRWGVGIILTAVCLMFGFSPTDWIKQFIETPPPWLIHDLTRVGFVLAGTVIILFVFFWDRAIRQRQLPPADESPDKHAPPPSPEPIPQIEATFRFTDGYAEICIRNLSNQKSISDVTVAIPNYSETLDPYQPKNAFIPLEARGGGTTINPRGQNYYRFAKAASIAGQPAIEIVSGDTVSRTTTSRECAIKFRVSARDLAERIYYIAAIVSNGGELVLGPYKRKKKREVLSEPAEHRDFIYELAALRTVETTLRNQEISTQQRFDAWKKTVATIREEIYRVIKTNISAGEAEIFQTIGNLMYSASGGFNAEHDLMRAALTRDLDYLLDLIIHHGRHKRK